MKKEDGDKGDGDRGEEDSAVAVSTSSASSSLPPWDRVGPAIAAAGGPTTSKRPRYKKPKRPMTPYSEW